MIFKFIKKIRIDDVLLRLFLNILNFVIDHRLDFLNNIIV